uniref:NB-ARC domain-containing protein n=1 Tax=Leersia perrieri TaxID=77586 RepID=A0A0D9XA99_9ORYZ
MQSRINSVTMSDMEETRRQLEKTKVDLVELINTSDNNLRVVAVWGTSGFLKDTSIIKRTYDVLKIRNKFECCAWIELMSPFNQIEFLHSIIRQFYVNSLQQSMDAKQEAADLVDQIPQKMDKSDEVALVNVFKEYVNKKRCLIVVLTVLSTIQEWDEKKKCFPCDNTRCRILVCTEHVEVARLCVRQQDNVPLEYKKLSGDETLYGFYEKGSQDSTHSEEPSSTSDVTTSGVKNSRVSKMFTRIDTVVATLEESQLTGRAKEKSYIIELIIKNQEKQQSRVISIWGMGGLGKTSLVQDIYRTEDVSRNFDTRACVTVLRPFNSGSKQFGDEKETELAELLEGKKYLVVLDDLWDIKEWDDIMPYLPNKKGSCIIVTTREENIANYCSKETNNIYKLSGLEDDQARELFMTKVFKAKTNLEEQYPELVEQANLILKKCNGLPLAIVTMGGFLANQPKSTLVWRKLNEHITAELHMNPGLETIRTVLLKSYDGLPYHLKSCFLYLSIFLEDQKISRERLMKRWSAEGYIGEAHGKSSMEIAHDMFIELISRSMILPATEKSELGREFDYCQLHDLMREISIRQSTEENLVFRMEEGCSSKSQGTIRHLAISSNWNGDQDEFETTVDLSRVRSLTVFGKWKPFFICKNMKMLRVLDLEDTEDLCDHHLEHVCKLLHLKYLSLRGCPGIHQLPDSLGELRHLETLDIRDTSIFMLPKSIIKLRKLRYLHGGTRKFQSRKPSPAQRWRIPCCILPCGANRDLVDPYEYPVPTLPRGSGKLKALHTLRYVHLAWDKTVVEEMESFTQLRKLGVMGIDKNNAPAFRSDISKFSRLESLSVKIGQAGLGCLDLEDQDTCSPRLEKLQRLQLIGVLGKLPKWIEKHQNLVKLRLESCKLEDADAAIQVLGALPSLAFLRMSDHAFNCQNEYSSVHLNFRQGLQEEAILFPKLRVLHLDMAGSLFRIYGAFDVALVSGLGSVQFGGGATPKLEQLLFGDLCSERILSGLKELPSLKKVILYSYNYSESNYDESLSEDSTVLSLGKLVLGGALGYANSALAEEVALQLGIQRDHAFIRDELEMMRSFLMVAHEEERDHNKVVKTWVQQVRDVAYDVEDCLHDLAVRVGKPSWWRKCSPLTLLEQRRVAQKMKDLRAKVEDVSQRNARYHLIESSGSKGAIADAMSMPGIDELRWQQERARAGLVRLITNKEEDLRVIAVWGPSGVLEKTSIIERTYDDLKASRNFECYACVSLRRPFNQKEFLLSIMSQIYENLIVERQEKQAPETHILGKMVVTKEDDSYLVDVFTGYLMEKNYLLVINDLSTIEEWNQIKAYFPNNKKGSRVVATTKQVEVATLCIGADNAKPELTQISADKTLYAFYEKGALDGIYSTKQASSSNRKVDKVDSVALNEFELIGRMDEKEDIINLVSNLDPQGLQVISVWGMGGLKKTTLVREVYQSPKFSGMFEKRAWVTIMRPFNCSHILKSLALQFGDESKTDLNKHLHGKRFLIVLDDVAGCIIVTTRQESIAKHCSNNESNIHRLNILEPTHARELFTRKVFKAVKWEEKYPQLVGLVEPILKKCGGLPIAIITIGGFLANQPKSDLAWRKLNEHISAELEMNPDLETIRTVLLKSYDGLPYYLKSCFLYLSIFPEDDKVSRKCLMQRWTAEGYTWEMRGKPAKETSHDMFMELMSRSMILPAQESIRLGRGIDYCQLHDLMREISITKSMEENLVLRLEEGCSSNTQGTTRHLAISSSWKGNKHEFDSMVDMSRVRSLTVFGEWKPFFISEKMRMLRVLDLEGTQGLVDHHLEHIGKFPHLKYLSLRGCNGIVQLPDSLGNLKQLELLDIRRTSILMLPKIIVKLRNLKYLHAGAYDLFGMEQPSLASKCMSLLKLQSILCASCCVPRLLQMDGANRQDACNYACCLMSRAIMMDLVGGGIGHFPFLPRRSRKLKNLQTLRHVHLAWGNAVIQEIERLTQLRKLGVVGINKKNGPVFLSAISKLNRLESLSMRASGEEGLRGCQDYCSTSPPSNNLQSLKLEGVLGGKLPEWIGKLQSLVKLRLEDTKLEDANATIQVLGALPSLAILRLWSYSFKCGQGDKLRLNFRREQEAAMFPSLRVLYTRLVLSNQCTLDKVEPPSLSSCNFVVRMTHTALDCYRG